MVSGFPVSLGPPALIVRSSTIPFALPLLTGIQGPPANLEDDVVQPLSNWISGAGTTLAPGGPAIKFSDTLMSLGPNVLVVGTSSILFANGDPTQMVTTIAGQIITANPTAVEIGSSTLTPGGPSLILSGTLISSNNADQLEIGSDTIPPPSRSTTEEKFKFAVSGQGPTADPTSVKSGDSGSRPNGPAIMSSGGWDSIGAGNVVTPQKDTSNDVQAFQGSANALKSRPVGIVLTGLLCGCLIRIFIR